MEPTRPQVVICAPTRDLSEWELIIRILKEIGILAIYFSTTSHAFDRLRQHNARVLVTDILPPGGKAADLIKVALEAFMELSIVLALKASQKRDGVLFFNNPLELVDPFADPAGSADMIASAMPIRLKQVSMWEDVGGS